MSSAHGAGLMLLPFALGLCAPARGEAPRLGSELAPHWSCRACTPPAMLAAGLGIAWIVYRSVGLKALSGWLNLEVVWGTSLVVAGAASIALAWPAIA